MEFQTEVLVDPRTGEEDQDAANAAATREAEAWKIAQLAAALADAHVRDGGHLDLAGQTEIVKTAEFILGFARERVAAKSS